MVSQIGETAFSGAKIRYFWQTTKLMGYFLTENIELGPAVVTIAEEAHADALPVAAMHGESGACRDEALAVSTVSELVGVLQAVVGYPQPESLVVPALDDLPLTFTFCENAVLTNTNTIVHDVVVCPIGSRPSRHQE